MHLSHKVGRTSGQCPLDVVWVEEGLDSRGSAGGAEKLIGLHKVGEEIDQRLALLDFLGLLEKHARGLLVHDHIDALKGWEGG